MSELQEDKRPDEIQLFEMIEERCNIDLLISDRLYTLTLSMQENESD